MLRSSPAPPWSRTMNDLTNPAIAFFAAYKAAIQTKDLELFMSLYSEDVQIFDAWDRWQYSGAVAWRGMAAAWFESIGTGTVTVEVQDVKTVKNDNVAAASAFTTYAAVSADGTRLKSLDNRMTVVLQREGDTWKVVHEHTSAPAGFSTKKVSLSRAERAA